MLIKYSYIKCVPVTQITKRVSCTEKFCASYRTIPLILYVRYFLFADEGKPTISQYQRSNRYSFTVATSCANRVLKQGEEGKGWLEML